MNYTLSHVAGEPLPLYKLLGSVAARIVEGAKRIPDGLEQQLVELEWRLAPAFNPDTQYASYSDYELAALLHKEWLSSQDAICWLEQLGIVAAEVLPSWPTEIVQMLRGLR
jgi:hypothetical protein